MDLNPRELLDTLLGYLGFVFEIHESEVDGVLTLQVYTREADRLVGRDGQTLEDLQFLLNRLLQAQGRESRRVVVDVEHYRSMRQDGFVQRVRALGEQVRATGQPVQLEPMNSFHRRLVHNLFKDDPEVTTSSPPDEARLKRMTLQPRTLRPAAPPTERTTAEGAASDGDVAPAAPPAARDSVVPAAEPAREPLP